MRLRVSSISLAGDGRLAKALEGCVRNCRRSKKDKGYQSRYKKIGLSDEDWKSIERVRQLRNDYGVAHYDLGDKIKECQGMRAVGWNRAT